MQVTVPQILRLPQELMEIVVVVLSAGDLTIEQISTTVSKGHVECKKRLDDLVKLGHLEEYVSCDQALYRTAFRTRPHKEVHCFSA